MNKDNLIPLALMCMVFVGHARRMQASAAEFQSDSSAEVQQNVIQKGEIDQLSALSAVLLALQPLSAFNPSASAGQGYFGAGRRKKSALGIMDQSRLASQPHMQDNKLRILEVVETGLREVGTREGSRWEQKGKSWVLKPDSMPWATVHFVGGAGFGAAPQLCYNDLLTAIADRLNVVVIATPYGVQTDHWDLSRKVHQEFQEVVDAMGNEMAAMSDGAPVFRLGHSLGAKLLLLGNLQKAEAGGGTSDDALGLLNFNNFGLKDSAALMSELIGRFQGGGERGETVAKNVFGAFNMMSQIAQASGQGDKLDVSPTPLELENAVAERYNAAFTGIWKFDTDNLDSSDNLLDVLPASAPHSLHRLEGSHLAPVVFSLTPSEIEPSLAMFMGALATQEFSFGDRTALQPVIDSVCDWISAPQSQSQQKTVPIDVER